MKKIVFILNSTSTPIGFKRIQEFISADYSIDAYGFERNQTLSSDFPVEIIGHIDNSTPYYKRIRSIINGIKAVTNKYRNQDVIFYVCGLEIAFFVSCLTNKPYIYEECDLVHTYMKHAFMVKLFEKLDLRTIRKAMIAVFTSEGFVEYHFPKKRPDNIIIVPNRLHSSVLSLPFRKSAVDINHLRVAFVGGARFNSIASFARIFIENFPQHELHFYGTVGEQLMDIVRMKDTYSNVFFHGRFTNPDDLPSIYEHVDLVLATYDTHFANVRYAEPNKLYEAAYFQAPIIVSENTFLASKVAQWGIGFAIDPFDKEAIISFFNNLSIEQINSCQNKCALLDKELLISKNPQLFAEIEENDKSDKL